MIVAMYGTVYQFLRFPDFLKEYHLYTKPECTLNTFTLVEEIVNSVYEHCEGEAGFIYPVEADKCKQFDVDYYFAIAPNDDGVQIITYVETR